MLARLPFHDLKSHHFRTSNKNCRAISLRREKGAKIIAFPRDRDVVQTTREANALTPFSLSAQWTDQGEGPGLRAQIPGVARTYRIDSLLPRKTQSVPPAFRSIFTVPLLRVLWASNSAERRTLAPSVFFAFTLAPPAINSRTHSVEFLPSAMISAVFPPPLRSSVRMPCCNSNRTNSGRLYQ